MVARTRAKRDWEAYLYLLPAAIFLTVFVYYGFAFIVYHSFFEWNGISANKTFIGLENYRKLITSQDFLNALKNTAIYTVITVSVQMALGFLVAVCLDAKMKGTAFFRGLFFLPNIMSLVVIAFVFNGIYNYSFGFLNEILRSVGLESWTQDWTGDSRYALYSVIIVNIFTYMGFSMIMYITGLTSINQEVVEAAKVDGAGFWNTIWKVVLPLLKGTHFVLIILGIIGSLKTFDIVWLLTQGGPARASDVVSTFLYRSYVLEYQGGYSAAVSMIIVVIALVMTVLQLTLLRKLRD